jgi:carbonic anhydrase/acetyltransferase-like protein (isoleucine patch superfamily)
MSRYPYGEHWPTLDDSVFVADGACVVGDVEIGADASVWFNAVIRGDSASVRIGARTNVQDGAVLHTDAGRPCVVGEDCTIGHRAIVHGCTVGSEVLVGMGAIILSGAVIGRQSLVGAGSLVPEGAEFPPRSLLVGSPARVARDLSDDEVERLIRSGVRAYIEYARIHRASV